MRNLRGVFIALHLFAITAFALPRPQIDEDTFEEHRLSFEAVADALGVSAERIQHRAWWWGKRYNRVRAAVVAPLQPYRTFLGVRQSWRMFATITRKPARLEIAVREDNVWRPVYLARDPDKTWNVGQLDHERMRTYINHFNHRKHQRDYTNVFLPWLARRIEGDFPKANRVRIRMREERLVPPDRFEGHKAGKSYWVKAAALNGAPEPKPEKKPKKKRKKKKSKSKAKKGKKP